MTIGYLLVTLIAIMLGGILVRAVDDSVATVAIIVFVLVYVITNELMITFITISIVIIVVAIGGKPYSAAIAGVINVRILMPAAIGVLFTRSFFTASVAERISVIIDMINAF